MKKEKKVKKEIPNCSICRWQNFGYLRDESNRFYSTCGAQGNILSSVAYNNSACKKLYKKMGEK